MFPQNLSYFGTRCRIIWNKRDSVWAGFFLCRATYSISEVGNWLTLLPCSETKPGGYPLSQKSLVLWSIVFGQLYSSIVMHYALSNWLKGRDLILNLGCELLKCRNVLLSIGLWNNCVTRRSPLTVTKVSRNAKLSREEVRVNLTVLLRLFKKTWNSFKWDSGPTHRRKTSPMYLHHHRTCPKWWNT